MPVEISLQSNSFLECRTHQYFKQKIKNIIKVLHWQIISIGRQVIRTQLILDIKYKYFIHLLRDDFVRTYNL